MFAPPRAVPEEPFVLQPTYSLRASAGNGNFLDSSDFEVIGYSKSEVPAGADFALYVGGDSMEPVYHDGQLVWVHKCRALRPGEVGIFSCDNEGYIKMYAEREPEHPEDFTTSDGVVRKQPVLVSYNRKYPDRVISAAVDFRIIGRVLC
jgi:phage repressor protein C with HTH and peptisase S24 domain